jgi:hypothetical protein
VGREDEDERQGVGGSRLYLTGKRLLTIYEHGFERIDRRAIGENECGGRDEALAIFIFSDHRRIADDTI